MEIFKKRSIALLCMILMIVSSTFVQANSDMNQRVDAVNNFFLLDEGDGFSIQKTLDSKMEFSNELANKFAIKYVDAYSDEIGNVTKAIALLKEAENASSKYEALMQLDQANNQLIGLLEKKSMNKDDEKELNRFYANLSNCNDLISHSLYNEKVAELESEFSGFPAGIFKSLFNLDLPEDFR